jgi:HSP20 family protein
VLLPEGVDPEAITASTKDGILEVVVPKRPEVLPRKVTVEVQR